MVADAHKLKVLLKSDNLKLFICIPAYNEEPNIAPIIKMTKTFTDNVFVCDDGSVDDTSFLAQSLGAHVIRNQKNSGKGFALRTLFEAVEPYKPDVVVVLDGDGQHNPNDIPSLVTPIINGEADIVIGSRYVEGATLNASLYRRVGLHIINDLVMSDVKDTQSGFRAFSSKALKVVMNASSNGYGVETEQINLARRFGLRILEVPVEITYSVSVITSKKNPLSQATEIILTILRLGAIDRPLIFLGVPGLMLSLFGMSIGFLLVMDFNTAKFLSIPLSFVSFSFSIIGILFILFSIVLYALRIYANNRV